MTATLFLSPPQLPLFSTSFSQQPLFTSFSLILKNPKPLKSLSSNATSFFLQNQSFSIPNNNNHKPNNNNNNNNEDGEKDEDYNEATSKIKMPTAPWMKGPLLLEPDEVLNLSEPTNKRKPYNGKTHKVDRSLTEKISGRVGKKVMKKVVQNIEKLQKDGNLIDTQKNWDDFETGFLMGQLEGVDNGGGSKFGRKKLPWEKEDRMVFRRVKREKMATNAELSLDKELLERLRGEASKMRKWVKVKKAGVTEAVVDEVHSIWANNELVMIKFDLPLCRNMDRAREIVEIKTGGLVVWSKKDSLVAYRGCNYQAKRPFPKSYCEFAHGRQTTASISIRPRLENDLTSPKQGFESEIMDREKDSLSPGTMVGRDLRVESTDKSLYEREGDRILEGLGPRFIDWWYPKPLPVDGDLLPEVVPGFKPPFRICSPRLRPQLTDEELTYLRKLARPLPVHFVLGRNSKLQGLAAAILKLWERTIIAKIAVKWGVPNTNNELMASELKRLTGGVLLLRNKFFIILYRGKDFLPGNIANMVVEKEVELKKWQLYEEDARLKAAETLDLSAETSADTSFVGTYSEFQHIQLISGALNHVNNEAVVKLEAEKNRLEKELRKQEYKLAILKLKIEKAEKELSKLNSTWKPSEDEPDQELLTEEERECFRKIALKMDRVLVLGRRGIFDGVIEGLHQHWKHRELVKVITMQKTFIQVVYTARFLERESGGILVSIDKLKKGHAIIIYRGKNYKRPIGFGRNLLDKRKALKRSLEMQRFGSLKFFAHQREKEIADLRLKLADLEKQSNGSD